MTTFKTPRQKTHSVRLNMTYLDLLQELKTVLAPKGLEMTDAQTFDVAICVLHELLVLKRGMICDPVKLMRFINQHFKKEFSQFFAEAMTKAGHGPVKTVWNKDGSVTATWGDGRMEIPAKLFEGERLDADSFLRELKAEGRVS